MSLSGLSTRARSALLIGRSRARFRRTEIAWKPASGRDSRRLSRRFAIGRLACRRGGRGRLKQPNPKIMSEPTSQQAGIDKITAANERLRRDFQNLRVVYEDREKQLATLRAENARLEKERDRAVAFAVRVERGEVQFAK